MAARNEGRQFEPDRRQVVAGIAAGLAALARPLPVAAETAAGKPFRIDLHHHVIPPKWVDAARAHKPDNTWGPDIVGWTPAFAVEQMDKHRIAYAVTELGLPGVWWAQPDEASSLARYCNEYVAEMRKTYPGRFGMFATVPLPYVDETLKEIAYAYDTLHADGIGLISSYGPLWPGDQKFEPVWQELNRRKAVIHVHPTVPNCCVNLIPDVANAYEEYLFDTARAITSLMVSGTLTRHPDLRFIFSHAGGAFPDIAARVTNAAQHNKKITARLPNGDPQAVLSKLYFDIASSVNPINFGGLRRFTSIERIVVGTDLPYVQMDYTLGPLDRAKLSAHDYARINTQNALDLFPQLKGRVPLPA
ncbi:MAG TPA: amidohydrolase family protein [Stellaceae bacterium]|jgi:predicted TIM-barrel fold metal-dependent hydrolase